ncbi:hypothetical protein [Nocardioides sp.]|uniref:hypothetical protein n=1 Tax=Nocardioides sp. TaxID=35761 RepID=UPI003564C016
MKKILTGLIAACLLSATLVGVSAQPAHAKCKIYTGCLPTKTRALVPKAVGKHSKVALCGRVRVPASSVHAIGRLKIGIRFKKGGYGYKRIKPYLGGTVCLRTGKLHKSGVYVVRIRYIPPKGSVFLKSKAKKSFVVRRR